MKVCPGYRTEISDATFIKTAVWILDICVWERKIWCRLNKIFPRGLSSWHFAGESLEHLFNITPRENKSIHAGIKWIVSLLLLSRFATNGRGSQGPSGCNKVERPRQRFGWHHVMSLCVCSTECGLLPQGNISTLTNIVVHSCDSLPIIPMWEISSRIFLIQNFCSSQQ